jgi:nucleoside-diphosphate-sugar epimerase
MNEILLTGANGFLGAEIVQQALAGRLNVCATDRGPGRAGGRDERVSAFFLS